ncbi:MAG TPA: rhamnulose-1-phosphate aldolase [Armatimonadota bacterium]|nr:rhamnulose-1-phosphate aldolase [Armatimonadota bacterium]
MRNALWLNPELARSIDEVGEVAGLLWQRGWAERNAGNISLDVTERLSGELQVECSSAALESSYPELAGRCLLVSGTGTRMRNLAAEPMQNASLVRISGDGASYRRVWGGEGDTGFLPTSELPSHLRIHGALRRRDAPERAVVHTHPTELIALTHIAEYCDETTLNRVLWSMHPEVKICIPEGAGVVPYRRPGSEALAGATAEALGGHRVAIWEKHGAVAVGETASEAFDLIDTLNKSARIFLLCKSAGLRPDGLTAAQLEEIDRVFNRRGV